jgi:hypothetical protein
MRVLRAGSNYAVYGIPDIDAITVSPYTPHDTVRIFDSIMALDKPHLAVEFACRLFVSRPYFHIAIKNPEFMERIAVFMKTNVRVHTVIRYAMRYGIYMLLKEERLVGQHIQSNNRSVFTEDEFRALPVFNVDVDDSPYFAEVHDTNKPLQQTLHMYLPGTRTFTDKTEFRKRYSYVGGGMFDGIDLSEYSAYVTGSSLVPCIVTNPLEKKFIAHDGSLDFAAYINNYYPAYNTIEPYMHAYISAVKEFVAVFGQCYMSENITFQRTGIRDTIHEANTGGFTLKTSIRASTSILVTVAEMGVLVISALDTLEDMESKLTDIDVGIQSTSMEDYETKVFAIFEHIKDNIISKHPDSDVSLSKQPIKFGYKWVLKGEHVHRPVDFFKVNIPPHALVFRFHLNAVRFWYDGKIVKGLASGICAALTGVNQWYRWFSNNKDPMDIVLKNMQRGYTTLLTRNEHTTLDMYLEEVHKYNHLIDKYVCGKISPDHDIFGHNGGIRYGFPQLYGGPGAAVNRPQYWEQTTTYMQRVMCDLKFTTNGMIIPPKIYAFPSIIKDLLD